MLCTYDKTSFTKSVTGATIIITITGFSWAVTQWAPFALVGGFEHSHFS